MRGLDQNLRSLATRSGGFLHDLNPFDTGCSEARALIGQFDATRYNDGLFGALAVAFPDRLRNAVHKRRAEFLAGRCLAMAALGRDLADIPTGPDRAPIWPTGTIGSITHSSIFCAALISETPGLLVGIDTEEVAEGSSITSIFQVALSPAEGALVQGQHVMPAPELATLVFSAKETLYKALYPQVRQFFGFDHAELVSVPTESCLRLRLTRSPGYPFGAGTLFDIHYVLAKEHVVTWLVASVETLLDA